MRQPGQPKLLQRGNTRVPPNQRVVCKISSWMLIRSAQSKDSECVNSCCQCGSAVVPHFIQRSERQRERMISPTSSLLLWSPAKTVTFHYNIPFFIVIFIPFFWSHRPSHPFFYDDIRRKALVIIQERVENKVNT